MNNQLSFAQQRLRLSLKMSVALSGAVLVGGLGIGTTQSASAIALSSLEKHQTVSEMQSPIKGQLVQGPMGVLRSKQAAPTLRRLLETMPVRPTADAAPVVEGTPSAPAGVDSGSAEPTVTDADTEILRLTLDLSDRRLHVYRGDTLETTYPVAVGRAGWETPTGEFEIFHQIKDPGWTNPITSEQMPPGPDNPLGDRWIAFWTDGTNSIGFHGTPNRESVGQAASHGCIRMYNEDVRELYDIVSVGTPVTVVQ